jgi:hypothetical protein
VVEVGATFGDMTHQPLPCAFTSRRLNSQIVFDQSLGQLGLLAVDPFAPRRHRHRSSNA